MSFKRLLICVLLFCFSGPVLSQPLVIEINKFVEKGYPIAIVPFEWKGGDRPKHLVGAIIEADLKRSGRFDTIPRKDFLSHPHQRRDVNYKDWRLLKAEYLVVGKVHQMATDRYKVQFELVDVVGKKKLEGFQITVTGRQLRKIAHRIADVVFENITGIRGAFDTRIAYVTVVKSTRGSKYQLKVADSDGYGPQTILHSSAPILSPSWSPDGTRLGYVSFEQHNSQIYVQNVFNGKRSRIAAFKGINSAPAWAPDGKSLAMVLSRDGNPEIYIYSVATGKLRRLTRHHAIDTEPAWSPDGKHIVFTSDRGGKPQIYRVKTSGGKAERLTFSGKYNARASYSGDGTRLALVTNQGRGYHIGVLDMKNRKLKVLTNARLDESPSFAPNGAMILYATQAGGLGVLAAVSADGRVKQQLKFQQGDVREPAWSPYNRKL
ncbi:Tol-Pal system beta propeller repeat protein TolB [Pseudomonadota bacterium]